MNIYCPICGQRLEIDAMPDKNGNTFRKCLLCCTKLRFGVKRRRDNVMDIRVYKEN